MSKTVKREREKLDDSEKLNYFWSVISHCGGGDKMGQQVPVLVLPL